MYNCPVTFLLIRIIYIEITVSQFHQEFKIHECQSIVFVSTTVINLYYFCGGCDQHSVSICSSFNDHRPRKRTNRTLSTFLCNQFLSCQMRTNSFIYHLQNMYRMSITVVYNLRYVLLLKYVELIPI